MESTTVKQVASTMRSLGRALDVLHILQLSRVPQRLSDISRESGLHLATTQRILHVLVERGYVTQDGLGYSMGITSLLNSHTYLVSNSLNRASLPILQELTASTGLTSSLSVRVDFAQVLLVRIESLPPLRYRLPVGEQMPLYLGGARVLAAALEPDRLDELLKDLFEIRLASGRVVSREEFIEGLELIRRQGYAYGYSQRENGAASVAVPVLDREGEVLASLQLSGLVEDFEQSKVEWYVAELKRACAAITRGLP
jgi:IclR family acetate operon transcriptional repressor